MEINWRKIWIMECTVYVILTTCKYSFV